MMVLLKVIWFLTLAWVEPKGVSDCLPANLALQKFFQDINFRFTRTTKRLQPVTATRIFPPRAIKYHKIHDYSWGKWPTVSLFFYYLHGKFFDWVISLLFWMKFLAYCGFPDHIYTSGIPEQLSISVYVHTMADGQARLRPRLLPTFKA